jgi:hypothetical protein
MLQFLASVIPVIKKRSRSFFVNSHGGRHCHLSAPHCPHLYHLDHHVWGQQ